jgi:hypothetical protein
MAALAARYACGPGNPGRATSVLACLVDDDPLICSSSRNERAKDFSATDGDKPPLRIFFGKAPLLIATQDYESRLATWNEWQPVSVEAYGA